MDRYTLIESYLMNVLSQADKQAFEARMSQEADLKADVEAHAKMKLALDGLVENDVRDQISEIRGQRSEVRRQRSEVSDDGNRSGQTIRLKKRRLYVGMAASFLVLAFVGWWGMSDALGQTLDPDETFEAFFNPLKSTSTRSNGEEQRSKSIFDLQIEEADRLIRERNYEEAYKFLSIMQLPIDHNYADNRTWLMALLKLKIDPKEAEKDFKSLASNPNHKYAKQIKKLLKTLKVD